MTYKVLITCPPMLRQIEEFEELFTKMDMEITAPKMLQTLSEKQLLDIVPKHDGWIIGDDQANAKIFKAGVAGQLKAAVKWGIGVDNVDFSACKRLGIPIINTPNMFGAEVADLALCYLLGLARDAFYIDREVRAGNWPKPAGISLKGKTVGIVGLGDIGLQIAKRAHAHEMNVCGWDPYVKMKISYINLSNDWPLSLNQCDFLIFACALTSENYHMFDEKIVDKLKPGVRIINVSRGSLINEDVLLKCLETGIVNSAALDVFEHEPLEKNHKILKHPKCILGSHNASNTFEAVEKASVEAIRLLNKFFIQSSK